MYSRSGWYIFYELDIGTHCKSSGHKNIIKWNPDTSLLFCILKIEVVEFGSTLFGVLPFLVKGNT